MLATNKVYKLKILVFDWAIQNLDRVNMINIKNILYKS